MNHRVLNLGAGTQSSVLLIMADRGEIEPVECAIFADTQAEPREVYDHLNWLEKQLKRTPVVRVTAGDLRTQLNRIPLKVIGQDIDGAMFRTCTDKFKIVPITQYIRQEIVGLKHKQRMPEGVLIEMVFGISFDERHRMRTSPHNWSRNDYPLVDQKLTRWAVIRLAEAWFPGHEFPRSACTFCPFHDNAEWRRIRDTQPEAWNEAIEIDRIIRTDAWRSTNSITGTAYLHSTHVPLGEVDLRHEDEKAGQLTLAGFANECEGMCGV